MSSARAPQAEIFSEDGSTSMSRRRYGRTPDRDRRILYRGTGRGRLTDLPGSSAYVAGGVVAYVNKAKSELLDVDPR